MSGTPARSHVVNLFETFNRYTLDVTPGGTPIAVFAGPQMPAYHGGNSFVMGGDRVLIAHDLTSLTRFLEYTQGLAGVSEAHLAPWRAAQNHLRAAACKPLAA